jgi:hypothetical protein
MLCNIIEGGKVRCYDYTANRNTSPSTPTDHDTPIALASVAIDHGSYTHVHYSEWPDRSVPEDVGQVRWLLE